MFKQIQEKDEIIVQQKIELNAEVDQKIALKQRLHEAQQYYTELQNENLSLKQYKEQFTTDLEEKSKEMEQLRHTIFELSQIVEDSRKMNESIEYADSSIIDQSNGNNSSGEFLLFYFILKIK